MGLGPTPEHWLEGWLRMLLQEKSSCVSVEEAGGRLGEEKGGFGVATCSGVQGGENLPLPSEEGPWSGSWVH